MACQVRAPRVTPTVDAGGIPALRPTVGTLTLGHLAAIESSLGGSSIPIACWVLTSGINSLWVPAVGPHGPELWLSPPVTQDCWPWAPAIVVTGDPRLRRTMAAQGGG